MGCGDGILTKDFLSKKFVKVDMIDQDPVAIKIVKTWSGNDDTIDRVEAVKIQDFQFKHTYSFIILRWVPGYLTDSELVLHLRRMKLWLQKGKKIVEKSNQTPHQMCLIIQEIWEFLV